MTSLTKSLQEYLNIRRALGFKLQEYDTVIKSFLAFLHQEKAKTITTKLALRWAVLPANVQPAHWARRLSMVRGFAEYRSATDPMTEVPSKTALPHMYHRAQPYIYSSREIVRLVDAAKNLSSVVGLRPHTYSTLFGLLAVTGMRMSESIHLDQKDVDLDDGVLLIRQSKFRKSRLVPIHSSTQRQLQRYACERDRLCPIQTSQSFFISDSGRRLTNCMVRWTFIRLSWKIGLRQPSDSNGPRLHDLRHRFAVQTLLNWYRSGVDVERHLPELSAYLGHVKVTDTYWYLTAVPELLQLAAKRLDHNN